MQIPGSASQPLVRAVRGVLDPPYFHLYTNFFIFVSYLFCICFIFVSDLFHISFIFIPGSASQPLVRAVRSVLDPPLPPHLFSPLHQPFIFLSYFFHISFIFLSYFFHISFIFLSYFFHISFIFLSYFFHISFI